MTTRTITADRLFLAEQEGLVLLSHGQYLDAGDDDTPFACAVGTLGLIENIVECCIPADDDEPLAELLPTLLGGLLERGFSASYIAGLDDGFEGEEKQKERHGNAWSLYRRYSGLDLGEIVEDEYQAGFTVGLSVGSRVDN